MSSDVLLSFYFCVYFFSCNLIRNNKHPFQQTGYLDDDDVFIVVDDDAVAMLTLSTHVYLDCWKRELGKSS